VESQIPTCIYPRGLSHHLKGIAIGARVPRRGKSRFTYPPGPGKHCSYNLILRTGPQNLPRAFPSFLQQLLFRMACGDTMPLAWNDICPQIPRSDHPDAPESIFFAGRGGVRLLA
jgi:hypothetical protein